MSLGNDLEKALAWSFKNPTIYLAGALNFVPLLLVALIGLAWIPGIQNLATLHGKALGDAFVGIIIPLLVLLIGFIIATLITNSFTWLAYAYAAKQFHDEQPLNLNDAFRQANAHWRRMIGVQLFWDLTLFGFFIGAFILVGITFMLMFVLIGFILMIPVALLITFGYLYLYAMFFYLPAIVAFSNAGVMDSVKASYRFIKTHFWTNLIFLFVFGIIVSVLQFPGTFLGVLGQSLWNAILGSVATTVIALTVTDYWLDEQQTPVNKNTPTGKPAKSQMKK